MAEGILSVARGEAWNALRWAAYGVLAFPLLSFLINGLWLSRRGGKVAGWAASALMGGGLLCALFLVRGFFGVVLADPSSFPDQVALIWHHPWMDFHTGGLTLSAGLGFRLDALSAMMVLVIASISLLVHIYSIGYMRDDAGAGRFFPILSFFTFAMLGLVTAADLVQTFICWELVGAASYLLIGFWYTRPAAVAASKKAFLLTRLADAFFLMGLLLAGIAAGSFRFEILNAPATAEAMRHPLGGGVLAFSLLGCATLAIYMGAWGKSALFPFHVWLPDAMEGPTPVSSLLHSATMVVAGVFLTARLFPLLSAAETTLRLIEATGAFTALFAAALACVQLDLKRILAYSTLSQLGLMMAALGTGAFGASMFHVFTHAFFKCLLFLAAGVVIHLIGSNDIRDAGGLRRSLPRTYAATAVAVAALAGLFPFAGFFSKEEILGGAWENGHYLAFAAELAASALTAFYMARFFFLVFHGSAREERDSRAVKDSHHAHGPHDTHHAHHPHESPLMLWPILILAVPSAVAGWLARGVFARVLGPEAGAHAASGTHGSAWLFALSTLLAAGGLALGAYLYAVRGKRPGYSGGRAGGAAPAWYRALAARFWIDEAWVFLARNLGGRALAAPVTWLERRVLNGAFERTAGFFRRLGFVQALAHSGQTQWYLAVALAGLFALAAVSGWGYR